jgi:COP9 signalosome complex subunit 6
MFVIVKQVFSHMDFLGWYTTGDVPTPADVHVHRQICEIYESPVLLKLNPLARSSDVMIYQCLRNCII